MRILSIVKIHSAYSRQSWRLCIVNLMESIFLAFKSLRNISNLISILSASDVCECCIILYRNPFCLMAIRCPSDVKYFWCERAIMESIFLAFKSLRNISIGLHDPFVYFVLNKRLYGQVTTLKHIYRGR